MRHVPFKTALKVIYWNLVIASIVLALGVAMALRRIHRYDALIEEFGGRHGVDARLVSAVIWRESRFRADCIGPRGEVGLMQVTEDAAAEWAKAAGRAVPSKADLFDVRINLDAGTWYLARAIRRWEHRGDPLPFALAEYNAGPANASRWAEGAATPREFWEAITYPTTKRYVHDILMRYRRKL